MSSLQDQLHIGTSLLFRYLCTPKSTIIVVIFLRSTFWCLIASFAGLLRLEQHHLEFDSIGNRASGLQSSRAAGPLFCSGLSVSQREFTRGSSEFRAHS